MSGAYDISYKKGGRDDLLSAFQSMLASAEVAAKNSTVVCRRASWVDEWRGGGPAQGQGVVKSFVEATIRRDKLGRFDEAFERATKGIIGLLANEHGDLSTMLLRGTPRALAVPLRRVVWQFVRDFDDGLPHGKLLAKSEWHPLLKARVTALLGRLEIEFSLKLGDNIGNKLARRPLNTYLLLKFPISALAQARPSTFPPSIKSRARV